LTLQETVINIAGVGARPGVKKTMKGLCISFFFFPFSLLNGLEEKGWGKELRWAFLKDFEPY
jgi:hypothetical protein